MSAGDLIVADAGSGEIRRFDREGELVRVVGGLGDGPGEYASLGWMGRYGDSLLTWDRGADRFTVYDRDLQVARTYLAGVPSSQAPSQVVRGVLADGHVIRSTGESFVPPISSPGIVRPPLSSYLQAPTGEIVASLGPFPGTQISVHSSDATGRQLRLPVPLGDRTIMAVGADNLLVADSESREVKVLSGGQVLVRIYRPNLDPRPASESDVRAEIERLIEPIPSDGLREAMRGEFETIPVPDNLPWVSALACRR